MKNNKFVKCVVGTFVVSLYASIASAQLSNQIEDSISNLNKRGKHVAAVQRFRKLKAEQKTLADRLAAAQSGWALGLVEFSRSLWNEVLATDDFKGTERYRTILALAILELQEGHYDRSRALAEKSLNELPTSDLKAQYLLLIGESLTAQGAHSMAHDYYIKAAEIGNDVIKSEANYFLGRNQLALGRLEEARKHYTAVELASEYSPAAIFDLAKIDLEQNKYNGVLTWIKEGRNEFPIQFEDPWIRYAMIVSLIETDQAIRAQEELVVFRGRYSDENSWYVLAQAAIEAKKIKEEISLLAKKMPQVEIASNQNNQVSVDVSKYRIGGNTSVTAPHSVRTVSFNRAKR